MARRTRTETEFTPAEAVSVEIAPQEAPAAPAETAAPTDTAPQGFAGGDEAPQAAPLALETAPAAAVRKAGRPPTWECTNGHKARDTEGKPVPASRHAGTCSECGAGPCERVAAWSVASGADAAQAPAAPAPAAAKARRPRKPAAAAPAIRDVSPSELASATLQGAAEVVSRAQREERMRRMGPTLATLVRAPIALGFSYGDIPNPAIMAGVRLPDGTVGAAQDARPASDVISDALGELLAYYLPDGVDDPRALPVLNIAAACAAIGAGFYERAARQ